jgi:hypothetical protein
MKKKVLRTQNFRKQIFLEPKKIKKKQKIFQFIWKKIQEKVASFLFNLIGISCTKKPFPFKMQHNHFFQQCRYPDKT